MNIIPKTEEEAAAENLAPKGEYSIEVLDAKERVSSSGNDMIEINIGIYDGDKIRWRCYDYLLESFASKLRHACDTFGILDKYQSGALTASDFYGRAGHAKIDIEIDKNGKYKPKNVARDYICRAAKPIAKAVSPKTADGVPIGPDGLPLF